MMTEDEVSTMVTPMMMMMMMTMMIMIRVFVLAFCSCHSLACRSDIDPLALETGCC